MFYESNEVVASNLARLAADFSQLHIPGYLESIDPGPAVSEWYVAAYPAVNLRGNVVGHPNLRDGPFESSALFYIDEDLRLARTLSRWFRLREPLASARNQK